MSEIEFSWLRDGSPLQSNATALRAQARMHGYLFIRGLIPAETIFSLRRQIVGVGVQMGFMDAQGEPMEANVGPRHVPSWQDREGIEFQGRVQQIPEFGALARDPRIRQILNAIFDAPVIGEQGNVCRLLPPQAPELVTPLHQDGHFIRNNPGLWTAWVPLGDCPPELGGLAILPGSHVEGILPHSAAGVAQTTSSKRASAHYRAGDVLFLHLLTVHCSLANRTGDRVRVSVDFRYRPGA